MPTSQFTLKVLTGGVKARVNINNMQAHRQAEGPTKSTKVDLNAFVIEAKNVVDVFVGPGAVSSGANLDLKIVRADGEGKAAKETKLASFRWEPGKTEMHPQAPTKVWCGEFTVDKAFGRWSWQDAPNTKPTAADQKEIVSLVERLHKALADKNADAAVDLMRVKIEEMGRAFGLSLEEMTTAQKENLHAAFSSKSWAVAPLVAEGMQLVPVADGRVYVVTDAPGKPPIKATVDKQPILFPISVTRAGGAWVIVR
jgi:hypothetical protein